MSDTKLNILVIYDDPLYCDLLRSLLKDRYDVLTVISLFADIFGLEDRPKQPYADGYIQFRHKRTVPNTSLRP